MTTNHSDHFKVALSTSLVVFGFSEDQLKVLLQTRNREPYKGAPSLPTRWVAPNEEVDCVAEKLLKDALHIETAEIEQLNAFSKLYRKPEGRVVNIAQISLVEPCYLNGNTTPEFYWHPINEVPTLVFDHNEILNFAKERLKRRIRRRPVGFTLLNKEFTIRNIHRLYEQGLNKSLDKRNFYKKLVKSELLVDTEKTITENGSKKPSHLYCFNQKEYERLTLKGYDLKF